VLILSTQILLLEEWLKWIGFKGVKIGLGFMSGLNLTNENKRNGTFRLCNLVHNWIGRVFSLFLTSFLS
jgi:hypothetical protein